jgi:hypothetical protein
LRFDLTEIPTTAAIVSAELILRFPDPIEDGAFEVYPLIEEWAEDEATWNQRKTGVPWTTAGAGTGSFSPTLLFNTAPRESGTYTIIVPVAQIQTWVAAPQINYGMKWISNSQAGRGGTFDSSEDDAAPIVPPVLRVRYQ